MKSWLLRLRNQNILFIGTIILTIVLGQTIIQYDLSQQNEDAQIINLSGRQRMLSQRIAKVILFSNEESRISNTIPKDRIDTLQSLILKWKEVHYSLLKGNPKYHLSGKINKEIDSLLRANSPHLEAIVAASEGIINNPVHAEAESAINALLKHDRTFLYTMERTVTAYQKAAEKKLAFLKAAEIVLSVLAIAVLMAEFVIIFLPIIKRLEKEINTLKIAEKNLEDNERLYRLLSENSQDIIVLLDQARQMIFVSQSAKDVLGYEPEELAGKILFDFMHPQDIARIKAQGDELRAGKEIGNMIFRMRLKTGEYRWGEVKTKPILNDEGKVDLVQAAFRDIHERKVAEEALKKSEERFRILTDRAPVGIYEMNEKAEVIYINKKWFDIAGLDPACTREDRVDAIHPEDKQQVLKIWSDGITSGEDISMEYRYQTKKGITWVSNSTVKILDANGSLAGYIGTVMDITSSKEAEIKIAESEKLYRLISTNSKDLITIFTADENARSTFVSPSSKEILGYEPEELLGTSPFDLMIPEEAEKLKAEAHEVTLSGRPARTVNRLRKKDGTLIWIEAYSSPIFDDNGKMTGFQSSARDITERKQFEIELIKAKEKAEEATLAKSQFLSMMSHEIRTPMNAIIGLTHLMLEDSPRPDQIESLKLLKFSGENLLTIINDILDLNKIEAGKITLENISFHLKELLQYHTSMLDNRANDRGIRLLFSYDDSVPLAIKGDPVRLGQIVNNLLSNAIKFTDKGYVELKVSLVETSPDGNNFKILFAVKDTGIGISGESIQAIFENFTQASADTTRKFGGTGLGLPITKKLLQLMGSDIKVESQSGYGSTFSFVLPAEKGNEEILLEKTAEGKQALDEKLSYAHILLVEDNKVNQVVARNFLMKWGIEVTLANHGKEALELIKQKNFDLVLMDLQMPVMDGYEATRQIRQMDDAYYKTVPIIALTASAMLDIKTKAMETGMTDFISKPFHPGELQSKIGKYIQTKSVPYQSSVLTSNLNLYSNGDPGFKNELIQLLTENLEEFEASLTKAMDENDPEIFRSACHKFKTGLGLIGNTELTVIIEETKSLLGDSEKNNTASRLEIIKRFYEMTDRIRKGLQKEENKLA